MVLHDFEMIVYSSVAMTNPKFEKSNDRNFNPENVVFRICMFSVILDFIIVSNFVF